MLRYARNDGDILYLTSGPVGGTPRPHASSHGDGNPGLHVVNIQIPGISISPLGVDTFRGQDFARDGFLEALQGASKFFVLHGDVEPDACVIGKVVFLAQVLHAPDEFAGPAFLPQIFRDLGRQDDYHMLALGGSEAFSRLEAYFHLLSGKLNGFAFEDQIFKGLAMGAPFVKLVGMARGPIAAAMVGKTIGRTIDAMQVPVYIERFGNSKDEIFVTASELRRELGKDEFDKLPTGALGLYTYFERLTQGLRQIMAGSRKFSLEHISRDDIAALTPDAARVSGISYIMDVDKEQALNLLNS